MQPRHVSILGVGLLGGSIGLALRRRISGCHITGYGHRSSTLDTARRLGAIDDGYDDPIRAVQGADFVILCTPVGTFDALLGQLGPVMSPGAILTDVGSTKRSVVAAAKRSLPKGVEFVGSHPMAGSEKRGIEHATADLYERATCIVTPTDQTDPRALESIEGFWRTLGMRTVRLSPEEHDRRLAEVSHLPHAVAAALVGLQDDESLPLAGKGFLDATRIAAGDGGLWRDILVDNRDNIRASIEKLRGRLDELVQLLEPAKGDELKAWLDAAARRRADMTSNTRAPGA